MCTQCLVILAALIFSTFPMSTRERGATPTSSVTFVERLRSELLRVLDTEALGAEDVSLPARRVGSDLTRARAAQTAYADSRAEAYPTERAVENPDGLRRLRPNFRRGSSCWWLWLLFGNELCGGPLA